MNLPQSRVFRALLIDLDGVVRLWPRRYSGLEHGYGLPAGALRESAFEPALLYKAVTGEISDEVWRQEVLIRLQKRYPASNARGAVEAWSVPVGAINQPVLELVRRARKSVKVALVTNATSRLEADLGTLGLEREFDAIVNSSVVGAEKPNEQIYRAAIESVGVEAEEALFADDLQPNVDAAQRLGMRVLHYEDDRSLHEFLEHNQVLGQSG